MPPWEKFLDFLFEPVAHKPPAIGLQEGAAVARYLELLSRELMSPERQSECRLLT